MLPSGIFRSRWAALLWAAGIVWTAWDVAAAQRDRPATNGSAAATLDATGSPVDLAVLANAGG